MGWSLWIVNFISVPKECVNEFIENINKTIQLAIDTNESIQDFTKYPGYCDSDCIGKGFDVQKIDLNDDYANCLGNENCLVLVYCSIYKGYKEEDHWKMWSEYMEKYRAIELAQLVTDDGEYGDYTRFYHKTDKFTFDSTLDYESEKYASPKIAKREKLLNEEYIIIYEHIGKEHNRFTFYMKVKK